MDFQSARASQIQGRSRDFSARRPSPSPCRIASTRAEALSLLRAVCSTGNTSRDEDGGGGGGTTKPPRGTRRYGRRGSPRARAHIYATSERSDDPQRESGFTRKARGKGRHCVRYVCACVCARAPHKLTPGRDLVTRAAGRIAYTCREEGVAISAVCACAHIRARSMLALRNFGTRLREREAGIGFLLSARPLESRRSLPRPVPRAAGFGASLRDDPANASPYGGSLRKRAAPRKTSIIDVGASLGLTRGDDT